jgi:hypothetical protein
MDFLAKFELSIIPSKQQVLHAASGRTLTKASTSSFVSPWSPETAVATLPPQVQKLLEEFPPLLRPSTAPPKSLHDVVHHIDAGSAAPVFARPRQLDPEKHRIAKEEFLALEKAGIILCSNLPWASLLHLVPKKDGSWRPCGDYRRLNVASPFPTGTPSLTCSLSMTAWLGERFSQKLILSKPTTKSPLLKKTFKKQQ